MGESVMIPVAALFVRSDSIYKTIPGVDAWDIDRDARLWPGGCPIVAHPPCRAWGQLSSWAKPRHDEKELAVFAVDQIRMHGGVLEHPYRSSLWPVIGLPDCGDRDTFGGWTMPVHQHCWGHRAEKRTKLYIVGCNPRDVPPFPIRLDEPTHSIGLYSGRNRTKLELPKKEREKTPSAFAQWLVDLARLCASRTNPAQIPHRDV